MIHEDYFRWAESVLDPSQAFEKPEALADIKIVELATLILGPTVPSYLSELGATVFKVELPKTGDIMRSLTPFGRFYKGAALGWLKEARNKYYVAIDVRTGDGKQLFEDLVRKSDVIVENLNVGTMEKWGLGYRQLRRINERLIYIALNGFGQWGPYVERPSYDAVAQSETGMASITGFPQRPPLKSGIWLGDHFGGLMGAVGVLAALAYRDKTGKGQYIELSQAENLLRCMDWTWMWQHLTGESRGRYGNRDVSVSPSVICKCKEDWIAICASTDEQFAGLCKAMKKEELVLDDRFSTVQARLLEQNAHLLLDMVEDWAGTQTIGEIEALACEHGFAAGKVCTAEDHFYDEHLIRRGFTSTLDDPIYGKVVEEGVVPKLSETPGRIKWVGKPVGFDNEYVFRRFLGLSGKRIEELEKKRVIGKWSRTIAGRMPPDDWNSSDGVILG